MAQKRTDNEIRITPSVLDRLLDYEPEARQEAIKTRSRSLKELKTAVRRDLEWLLNARRYPGEIDERLEEIKKSVIAFGLPDFTGASTNSSAEQQRLTKALETALKTFEPRFTNLKVTLEPLSDVERMLKFRIEANLDIEPSPEPISFDTVLQLGSGDFAVKEHG